MKQWILILVLAFAAAAAFGQKAIFFFPAQSATLSAEQVDSIEALLEGGASIDSVAGWANQLRNTRTLQANAALALDRADAALSALNYPTAAVGYFVARSNKASDRRVEIFFSTQASFETSTTLAGEGVEDTTPLALNSIETGADSSAANFNAERGVADRDSSQLSSSIDTSAAAGETGIELPDSLIWLPAAAPSLELAAVVAVETPTPCECGEKMDRYRAVRFYFEVVDSATSVLQAMHASKGAVRDSLRTQFRTLRAKANGVRNCIKKSRQEALAQAKANGETIRFIPIKRSFVERYGDKAPCAAGEAATKKAVKKAAKRKRKRRGGRFSLRRHKKLKAFRHSRWKAFVSRLACRGM